MQLFPTTLVDNFFEDPNSVRELALKQNYQRNKFGIVNGVRSNHLQSISPQIYKTLTDKILSMFYDLDEDVIECSIDAFFHKNIPYECGCNYGWVHRDSPTAVFGGLVYLTPQADLDTGTSFYKLKVSNENALEIEEDCYRVKKQFHRNAAFINEDDMDEYDLENYKKHYSMWHDCFTKTLTVKNVYNRMILFDGSILHSADRYSDDRLSLVFFVKEFKSKTTPILKLRG
jgi:hypothetical protein